MRISDWSSDECSSDLDLGVDHRGIEAAVAQEVGNVLHRYARTQQAAGHAMAEHMNVGVGPPTSLVGRDDSAPCDPLLDRTVIGCDVAHEDRAARGCWPFMLQIARDRAAGRGR